MDKFAAESFVKGAKVRWPHIIALYAVQMILLQIMLRVIFPIVEQDLVGLRVPDMVKQGYDSAYIDKLLS